MKELKYIYKLMWDEDPFMYFIVVINSIINGVLPFIWILAPAYVINNIDKGLEFFIPFFVGLLIITSIMRFTNAYLTGNYRMRMNNIRYYSIRNVISYSMNLSYADQQDKKHKQIISQAIKSIEAPFWGLGMIILDMPIFIGGLVSLVGFVWIFSSMDLWLVIYVIVLTIISAAITYTTTQRYERFWELVEPTWEQNKQISYEMRNAVSKLDIIMYNFFPLMRSYNSSVTRFRFEEQTKVNKEVIKVSILARFISVLRDIPVFYWLITSFVSGAIGISDFYVFFSSVFSFVVIVDRLSDQFAVMMKDIGLFKPYMKVLEHESQTYENTDFNKVDIEFKDVSFKYPSSKSYILKNINLKLDHGESLAVVGENGAGKTTFAHILAGLYEPTSGQILLNGRDINEYNINRKNLVSAVFQDTLVLPYSIRENVLMNDSEGDPRGVYEQTGLDQIVDKYDKGDDQVLLRLLDDKGVDLSGGQKQRLFLARAMNKSKAKILILDEPTAQLDSLAERDLYELYNTLTEDKSSIFISHRLASTKFCDKVIYLRNGEIVQEGTHDELMESDGPYRDLYDLQAKNYREGSYEEYN